MWISNQSIILDSRQTFRSPMNHIKNNSIGGINKPNPNTSASHPGHHSKTATSILISVYSIALKMLFDFMPPVSTQPYLVLKFPVGKICAGWRTYWAALQVGKETKKMRLAFKGDGDSCEFCNIEVSDNNWCFWLNGCCCCSNTLGQDVRNILCLRQAEVVKCTVSGGFPL